MNAQHLLESLRVDADTVAAVFRAFDQAWSDIASNYTTDAASARARLKLASAMLAVAPYCGRDTSTLRMRAIERMEYRETGLVA